MLVDVPFVLSNGNGQAGQSVQPVTLYLTIAVSANATSRPILPINAIDAIATDVDASPMEQATEPAIASAQDSFETTPFIVAAAPEPLSPLMDHVPIGTSSPIPPDVREAMSPAESALDDAYKATNAINLTSAWEGAVERIKWVMDTVSPVAGVRHTAISCCLILD